MTISFPEDNVGYATGEEGTILTYKNIYANKPEIDEPTPIIFYPNPDSDHLTILLEEPFAKGLLSIFDIHGKALVSQNIDGSAIKVNIASFSRGVYFIRIVVNQEVIGAKFIKH